MTILLWVTACGVAVVAAARSTWSPCGLSMLSTITPVGERARGHRYGVTVSWFALGSLSGGACLGAACAGLAAACRAIGPPQSVALAISITTAVLCAASDSSLGGFELPIHRRQVNETWLDHYRPWVYGLGFGAQIGCGLVTYIRTCAVYLMIVLAVASGSPMLAFAACAAFGVVRGLAVLLSRKATNPDALRDLHRRLSAFEPLSRGVTVGCVLLCAVALAVEVSDVAIAALGTLLAIAALLVATGILPAALVGAAGNSRVNSRGASRGETRTNKRAEAQSSIERACSGQFSTASRASFSLPSGTSSSSSTQCP